MGVTPFADLTPAEFRVRRVISAKDVIVGEKPSREVSQPTNLPPSVDWVAKGMVTPVQNQGQLGASWAFSSVATVESAHAILTGKLVKLSEAQVADCCSPYNGTGSPYDNIFSVSQSYSFLIFKTNPFLVPSASSKKQESTQPPPTRRPPEVAPSTPKK